MPIKLANNLRDARLQEIVSAIGANGIVRLYAGVQPNSVATPPTGDAGHTLLAQLDLSQVAATVNNGVLTFNPISNDISADGSGNVTWGRIYTSNGVGVIDFDCGTLSSSAVLKFTDTVFSKGDTIEIKSFTLTEGNA